VDENGTHLDFKGNEDLLYLKPELFFGKTIYETLPRDVAKKYEKAIKKTLQTKLPTTIEYSLHVQENLKSYEARNLYFSKNRVAIFVRDITDRKDAERGLKESEEKFRTIAEQSFMGIIIVQDGKIEYMNKALRNMSQYPVEEMLNWPVKDMVKMIHPDGVEYMLKRLQSNREGTMSHLSRNSFRIINRSGETRWLEDYTSKIIYQGKEANLISIIDVTDKKQAEQLIIEENKRLLELEELRQDLITRVSHELKTPMTSIYGTMQILLGIFREKLDKETLKYVKIGYRGCLRLKDLIENLLDASRLESKKFELKLQKEDLGLLIDDCVNDISYLAETRNQAIEIVAPHTVDFEIDRLRFRQVITNIISNAIKNTPRGGNIVINLNGEEEFIDILVRDNGVGLTQKEKERLFEKFGKIERYGMDLDVDIEGCGLGLYISKEIVELHGGQILVESEGRNKGSTFTIRLFKS
jgi:PAS domain S-box-containing protein